MSQHRKIKRCRNCRARLDNKRRLIQCTFQFPSLLFGGQIGKCSFEMVKNKNKLFGLKENMTENV